MGICSIRWPSIRSTHLQQASSRRVTALLVTGSRGLLRFATAEVVPEGAGPISCVLLTPVLFSPDREDQRRWLRVDATATLPEGSSIEIAFASTDDTATRDRLNAIAADASKAASQRVRELRSEPDLWRGRAEFHGSSAHASDPKAVFAAKLFEVRDRYLWVAVTLSAAAGGRLPLLSELAVLYPGRTLMENLPSIYQREESRPDSFLRSLVGVLEATTQGIDARIAAMGSLVHPATAPGPWLDFLARWLGLPWDDALSEAQKRAIVTRAAELAKGRGTRAGLEALLDALIPGTPRRFRVIDATADFGFAIVGDAACAGSALPAMLGGRTAWSAELNSRAVLGHMRLPCDGQRDDGTYQLAGRVQIDVAATAAERKSWTPWLHRLIAEMVPLTARVTLRWVSRPGAALGSARRFAHARGGAFAAPRHRRDHQSRAPARSRCPPVGLGPGLRHTLALMTGDGSMDTPDTHKPASQRRRTKKECCTDLRCESGLRNNYFEGKRLTPEMFRIEQRYLLERRQLLNRAIHGWGVVYGYGITAEASEGYKASESRSLTIRPGLALDECGRELLQAGVAYLDLEDAIVLDEEGRRVDREKAFAAATQYTRAQGQKVERVCWLLSVHYAEQRGGHVQITDPCRCDHHEWDHTCETVRYVLRRIPCDECCDPFDCELHCGCGTGRCCEPERSDDPKIRSGGPEISDGDLEIRRSTERRTRDRLAVQARRMPVPLRSPDAPLAR